jgi:predicted phage-related endonuclease
MQGPKGFFNFIDFLLIKYMFSYYKYDDHITVETHRRSFIDGSDARIIMGDDLEALVRLWREKRGEVEPEDLSGNLIVQLGTATEDLNRQWYERNTGHSVGSVQRRLIHPIHKWMAANP